MHRSTVWLWIRDGVLPSERVGVYYGVDPAELAKFIKKWPGLIERAREAEKSRKAGV